MTTDNEAAASTEPAPATERGPSSIYWNAQTFADTLLSEFQAARRKGDMDEVRERFYVLASYYRRSLNILHSALEHRREALAEAALQNLIVLQSTLTAMRKEEPDAAQSTLALESVVHHRVNRDLVHRILRDARGPLQLRTILTRFNELDLIADARPGAVQEALETLVETGHAVKNRGAYAPSRRPYLDTDVDHAGLLILAGPALGRRLADAGFEGLSHVLSRPDEFRRLFQAETGFGARAATLATACAAALSSPGEALHAGGPWQHADLESSAHPRPYQRLLHAVFRAGGYASQVIEAPAGSGKTLIGMLCIQDWLRSMTPGQSILVLVPTVNYQRQWVAELCLKHTGLRLSPGLVFAGTPAALASSRRRTGALPPVLVLTYAALSRAASGAGKGGFDRGSIERFLQGNNVRHVVLDEVHKLAVGPGGAEDEVVRVFRDWQQDGSLSSLIGFSGTVAAFQDRLRFLGLELAYVMPATELIAQGWVAPFAEFGAPFNYSQRERAVVTLIAEYRALLRDYLKRIGPERLRMWFAAIPLAERAQLARVLGMYAGRRDATELIEARLRSWEAGGAVRLNEVLLVSIVQLSRGWSDRSMLVEAGLADEFDDWRQRFEALRQRLQSLLPHGRLRSILDVPGLGERIETIQPEEQPVGRGDTFRERLASTFVGAYLAVRTWTRQAGEGRVAAVRSIIAAERATRPVSGVIVFDSSRPLDTKPEPLSPGYRGAGGLFVQMLGDPSVVPMAALASAIYLPDLPGEPVHDQIASWIERHVIGLEQRDALLELLVAASSLEERRVSSIRPVFYRLYEAYASALTQKGATRVRDFDRLLLRPLREAVREAGLGPAGRRILGWLSGNHHHLRNSILTILDYAAIASSFRAARPLQVVQGDGERVTLRLVAMPGGRRRQLLLDLTARIVDAPQLPVNLIVVTDWARTGWNVVTPNVLIDATATRNVTAWKQLRGRAMRPAPAWSGAAERLVRRLLAAPDEDGSQGVALDIDALPPDERALARRFLRGAEAGLATRRGREALAVAVMLGLNKVTHVYELLRAHGGGSQVRFSRSRRRWLRSPAVAAKHRREEGVRPLDGAFVTGESHAPLIVAENPRTDLPAAFEARLGDELASADERIVRGWLRAAALLPETEAEASDLDLV